MMWFSGLRGAVAFALGVRFLQDTTLHQGEYEKGYIFGTTVMVIIITVLGFGGLMPYMLRWLGIVQDDEHGEHVALATNQSNFIDAPPNEDEDQIITEEDLEQPLFGWLYRFDCKYIHDNYFNISI